MPSRTVARPPARTPKSVVESHAVAPTRPPGRPASALPDSALPPRSAVAVAVVLGCFSVLAWPYYSASLAERVRHPWHQWLRPSGYVGQTAGLLALAIFFVLWLYPLRKRLRTLTWAGPIARWLEVHVQLAFALPLLVAVHAGWRFTGLIGVGFWAMLVVWLSGIIGRYLYIRIPRGKAGVELSRDEIAAERQVLLAEVAAQTGLESAVVERALATDASETRGLMAALRQLITDDFARRRAVRRLQALAARTGRRSAGSRAAVSRALRLARREVALSQQARMLDATHGLFRYWHVAHRPVAIGALVAVMVHVIVVVAVGATWLR